MPRRSFKTQLIEAVASNAIMDMDFEADTKEIDNILDDFVEDISVVMCSRYAASRMVKTPKSTDWFYFVLPNYAEREFKENLRVTRKDFGRILGIISQSLDGGYVGGTRQFPIEYQLALTLYRFGSNGTGSSWSKVAQKFGIGNGTVHKITKRVIKAILSVRKEWIYWPDEEERRKLALLCPQLPGCVAIVDGSHINLEQAPLDDPQSYFSRKMRYAIHLQAVCDAEFRIRHIFVGYPGSVHDAKVFMNCDISKTPERYFNHNQWMAGDSAYKLTPYMITTLRTNATIGTVREREKFNRRFCNFRVKIEQVYGNLKETFSSLKELRMLINYRDGHKFAVEWITACCIIYNIVLDSLDEYPITQDMLDEEDDFYNGGNVRASAISRRNEIFNFVVNN